MMLMGSFGLKESQMFQRFKRNVCITAEQMSQLTLKVANASEAMSKVDISTYLKKS